MGLDITGYEDIKATGKTFNIEEDEYISVSDWKQSNMKYIEEQQIEYKETHCFRAGSYGGYNSFRNNLCTLANNITVEELWKTEDESLKFYWLINFSDCEGYIGTSYCKILYDEFVKYNDKIMSSLNDFDKVKYKDFKEAFRLGSNNGLVDFH